MSAIVDFMRDCTIPWGSYDLDEWSEFAKRFERACGLAADHIEELETVIRKKDQRIADLETLFEPFLKNFLKDEEEPS